MWCVKCHFRCPQWTTIKHPEKCPQCSKDLEVTSIDPYLEAQKLRAKNRKQRVSPEEHEKNDIKPKEDISFVFQKKNLMMVNQRPKGEYVDA